MPALASPAATDERAARRRARLFDLSLVLGLVLLLLGVSASAPRWSRFLRQPVQGAPDEPAEDAGAPATPTPAAEVQRTINVKLFFPAQDGGGLMLEERTVPFSNDLARQVEALVEALLAGSQQHAAALPAGTRVLSTFVTGAGVAYVSLSKEARAAESGGSRAELLSVYALVDSITANFPALNRVQLLIDDQPAATLLGHVDLSRPLAPDMSFLAAAEVRPAEPPPSPDAVGVPASPAPAAGAAGAAR